MQHGGAGGEGRWVVFSEDEPVIFYQPLATDACHDLAFRGYQKMQEVLGGLGARKLYNEAFGWQVYFSMHEEAHQSCGHQRRPYHGGHARKRDVADHQHARAVHANVPAAHDVQDNAARGCAHVRAHADVPRRERRDAPAVRVHGRPGGGLRDRRDTRYDGVRLEERYAAPRDDFELDSGPGQVLPSSHDPHARPGGRVDARRHELPVVHGDRRRKQHRD
ncbi:hypothetical protein ON010_g17931 [Phytophthora cinnamomi]|nr:hypothetical protein ON010_g17931 [Phytophthora cinnamomi]